MTDPKPDGLLTDEARKALRCLYLEVPEAVARDVAQRVEAAFAGMQAEIDRLRAEVDDLIMERERCHAAKAVLIQALAQKAQQGEQEWAQRVLAAADGAALSVRREDLRVPTRNDARERETTE